MARSRVPLQSPPVHRPHFVEPHSIVDLKHGDGDAIVAILTELLHGANFNDPPALRVPTWKRMAGS